MERRRRTHLIGAALVATLLVPTSPAHALPDGTKVQVYQGGLDFPIDMAWVSRTRRIFFTQKGGAIRMMKGGRLLRKPCATLPVNSAGERGLLGIALDPHYKRNHRLYVYYTNSSPLENRVARFVVRNDRCRNRKNIVRGLHIGDATNHNGGQLEFMRGKLFVSTGENASPSRAQDRNDRMGKILRYNSDGSVPRSNPFNNAVWTYGHRNPFGLAHKPGTGKLYSSENGESCDDELNLIRRSRNYGWGDGYSCKTNGVGANPKGPLKRWTPVIVPTDPGWYRGRLKRLSGSLYMGSFNSGRLYRFRMNRKGTQIRNTTVIHDDDAGIVDVSVGPRRWLYYLTSDAIKRIVPSNKG